MLVAKKEARLRSRGFKACDVGQAHCKHERMMERQKRRDLPRGTVSVDKVASNPCVVFCQFTPVLTIALTRERSHGYLIYLDPIVACDLTLATVVKIDVLQLYSSRGGNIFT